MSRTGCYFLNQASPIPVGFGVLINFYDTRNEGILFFFLTNSSGEVTIKAVIAYHLFAMISDMGGHGRKKLGEHPTLAKFMRLPAEGWREIEEEYL